jgi:hypothetical protein
VFHREKRRDPEVSANAGGNHWVPDIAKVNCSSFSETEDPFKSTSPFVAPCFSRQQQNDGLLFFPADLLALSVTYLGLTRTFYAVCSNPPPSNRLIEALLHIR